MLQIVLCACISKCDTIYRCICCFYVTFNLCILSIALICNSDESELIRTRDHINADVVWRIFQTLLFYIMVNCHAMMNQNIYFFKACKRASTHKYNSTGKAASNRISSMSSVHYFSFTSVYNFFDLYQTTAFLTWCKYPSYNRYLWKYDGNTISSRIFISSVDLCF